MDTTQYYPQKGEAQQEIERQETALKRELTTKEKRVIRHEIKENYRKRRAEFAKKCREMEEE